MGRVGQEDKNCSVLQDPGTSSPLSDLEPRHCRSVASYAMRKLTLDSKMYSDTILQSDPKAYILTLAEERAEAERNRQRASAWSKKGGQSQQQSRQQQSQPSRNGSLAARLGGVSGGGGGGSYRGRGTAGGMMVD